MNQEQKFMQKAIELAKKGAGKVSPNPMVGCVIVKNNKIISTGYHQYFGGSHAEASALSKLKGKLKNAVMYVTLEPCCHTNKKTPPCVPEVIRSGIKSLVIAMKDPNPEVAGKGISFLRKNGIKCRTGVLENEAKELNKPYIKWITQKMPYVTLKWAMSLDGKIATRTGDSKWISSETSRSLVHRLRAEFDAILVGIDTVLKDNPCLTSHGKGKNPVRIIIDPNLEIPLKFKVMDEESKTIIFYNKNNTNKFKYKLELINKKYHKSVGLSTNSKGIINLKELLKYLANEGIVSVLIEGGGNTNALALEQGIVDEIIAFISPKIIGGRNAITPVEGLGVDKVKKSLKTTHLIVHKCGDDFVIAGKIEKKRLATRD